MIYYIILILIIVGIIIFFTTKNQTEIEKISQELIDICNSEKISIKAGADKLMEKIILEKNNEIKELKEKLDSEISLGKISQQNAQTNLDSKVGEISLELQTTVSNLQKIISEKEMIVAELTKNTDNLQKSVSEKETIVAELKQNNDNLQKSIFEKETLLSDLSTKLNSDLPTPWVCGIDGMNAPIRVNKNKDIECMSLNNKDCLWRPDIKSCQDTIKTTDTSLIKPLDCGPMYQQVYNQNGYSGGWCKTSALAYNLKK